jgi:PAS domain-containing protein
MERTKTHESLYASSLIEATLDPLITISLEGKITDMNQAKVNITGVERKKIIWYQFLRLFYQPAKSARILSGSVCKRICY